ncbi:MAG TPA: aryl-sulfate sulfotransferase [Bryobacteraceae bacterium]|nr:aryl-sulfate sulfotransferase [Bryobacteraceae bacterium]
MASPQLLGTAITWTAKAGDTGAGPVAFQFNVAAPGKAVTLVKDFVPGTLNAGVWTSRPFVWVPISSEGGYEIQVVVKDFGTGESAKKTVKYTATPLATGSNPVITATANPLVAIFSAPACPTGSSMRISFQIQNGSHPAAYTNWTPCRGSTTMNFEIGGMLQATGYYMHAQTKTGSQITNGATRVFTAGSIPGNVVLPGFSVKIAAGSNDPNPVILHSLIQFGGGTTYANVATDLAGNIIWYYWPTNVDHFQVTVRPVTGGGVVSVEDDYAWDPNVFAQQYLRQVDLAGNVVKETNIGALQQQLLAKGFAGGVPCQSVPDPAPVGTACIGGFHHDAIQTLPGGKMALFVSEEKLFPAGTQGDTSGLPVDIIGDMILVVDSNWQITWYWDSFDAAGGGNGYPQLPASRTAVLGDTCGVSTAGCPPVYLLSAGNTAPLAHDWLHSNSLYYWPAPQNGNSTGGDIIWSSRHQDWVFRIDYRDGAGTGDILWRMGPSGDFTFMNTYNDVWPWFSHQHDVAIEGAGSGVMTIFDNGNTRVSNPGASTGGVPGLGLACGPYDCNSRGMAVTFDESAKTVTPTVSFDLGNFSTAMGSAQLLSSGYYFFENPAILINLSTIDGYSLEITPTPPAPQLGAANKVLNLSGPEHYRAFQMPNLYSVPTT